MDIVESSYTGFLDDAEVYDALEQMWLSWFNEIAIEHDILLAPFFNNLNADGEKIRDANPIFSGLEPSKNRLLRILQIPKEEVEEIYIQGWTDVFGAEEEEEGIEELVIDLVLSDTAKVIAKEWIIKWLVEAIDREEMEEILEEESVLVEEEDAIDPNAENLPKRDQMSL
ncbi:MAG: hypothetical protein AAGG68_30440 [Bacteroidota bacterium]